MLPRWPRLGLAAALLLAAVPANALHRVTPGSVLFSRGSAAAHPSTRSWGYMLAFSSTEDLAGMASTGRQVFVFGLFNYDCQYGTPNPELSHCPHPAPPALVQATTGPGAADNPSATAGGTLVAFDADGAYGGGTGPGVGHRQIFVVDLTTSEILRVTDAADGDSTQPSLSEGGGDLVFESTAGLGGGPAGPSQIYHYDVTTGFLTRITHGAGPSHDAMPTKLGRLVSFSSTAALRGDGHDTGVSQIFWYDTLSGDLHQLTSGNAPSQHPHITTRLRGRGLRRQVGRGAAIAFDSQASDLPGTAGGPGTQVYVGTTSAGDLPPLVQLTPPAVAGCTPAVAGDASFPAIDAFGRRIAFVSSGDTLCNGTTGNRAFVLDPKKVPFALLQLTGRGDVQGPLGMSFGHWFVTLSTTDDLTGAGVCGHQLHVLDFLVGHWNAATTPGSVPPEPTAGSPVAGCDDGNACTVDSCVAAACQHAPIPGCP
jgi:hypothetical protein